MLFLNSQTVLLQRKLHDAGVNFDTWAIEIYSGITLPSLR